MEEMAEASTRRRGTPLPSGNIIPMFQQPGDGEDTYGSTLKSERSRRRGSLSVSRFGQVSRVSSLLIDISPSVHWYQSSPDPRELRRRYPRPDRNFSICVRCIVAHSQIAFIRSPSCEFCELPCFDHDEFICSSLRVSQAPSVDSFGTEEEPHEASVIDDHVTQMRHISGKPSISKTVGGMISRTISTRRSKNNLKVVSSHNLFIGVSVTEHEQELEASELENEFEGAKGQVLTTATVHAPLKKQPSKRNMESPVVEGQGDWISRARKFGRKIRRKSQAWLNGQGPKAVAAASPTSVATATD